jgi:hypothetical protein
MIGLLQSNIFVRIQEFFGCLVEAQDAAEEIKNTIWGITRKLVMLGSVVLTIPIIVKILISIMCQQDAVGKIISIFRHASVLAEQGMKYYFYGKGIGLALQFVATSRSRRRFRK